MLIPTAVGINTAGQRAGPSTTSWILPLDLSQVSTIAPAATGNITRQLTLADLGTDCPQTADPTAIATMVDSRCDPVLAAPTPVREWAYPCNACGRFGLFDPPYAVPTLTGGLVEPTVTSETSGGVVVVTVVPPTATATATSTAVAQTTPASTGGGAGSSSAAAGSGAGAGSSGTVGTGTGVTSAAGSGAGSTASVVGSGSVGASTSTAAPPVTAAGARAGVGESVAGMWGVLGVSIVSAMFWL